MPNQNVDIVPVGTFGGEKLKRIARGVLIGTLGAAENQGLFSLERLLMQATGGS